MTDANGEYPTVIGPDAVFKGELTFEKGVRLLGQFDGQIETKGNVLVAEGAKLKGEVKAGGVRLDGEMLGNLEASGKVHLAASAKLEGDLRSARLEVEDGATFVGKIMVGPQAGKSGPQPAPQRSSSGSSPQADQARGQDKSKTSSQPEPAVAGKR